MAPGVIQGALGSLTKQIRTLSANGIGKNPARLKHVAGIFNSIYINEVHRATKETAETWTGNRYVALQTTLSTEVAHFTQHEKKDLHKTATCNLTKPQQKIDSCW